MGAFDQKPAGMRIAALGDSALPTIWAAGGFAGHKPKIGHELPRMVESMERTQFGDGDHGGHDLEALEGHESFHRGFQSPGRQEVRHGSFASLNPRFRVRYRHEAFFQDCFHSRMGQSEVSEVAHVGGSPVASTLVMVAVLE